MALVVRPIPVGRARAPFAPPENPTDGSVPDRAKPHLTIYNHASEILISFLTHDSGEGGFHYETARIACAILTGREDLDQGYLSETRNGPSIASQPDDLLMGPRYHFVVPGESEYRVVPFFRAWKFPQTLPQYWNLPPSRTLAENSCIVTRMQESIDNAHVIPISEVDWFRRNQMVVHAVEATTINDPANVVRLRKDIHGLFDSSAIVILPKFNPKRWVVHALRPGLDAELLILYHNVPVRASHNFNPSYWLARYAWSLFKRFSYLNQPGEQKFRVYKGVDLKYEDVGNDDDWVQRNNSLGSGRSPSKRQRSDYSSTRGTPGAAANQASAFDFADRDEEDFRGRKRTRSFYTCNKSSYLNLLSQSNATHTGFSETGSSFSSEPNSIDSGHRPAKRPNIEGVGHGEVEVIEV